MGIGLTKDHKKLDRHQLDGDILHPNKNLDKICLRTLI
jgi:gluconate kinase